MPPPVFLEETWALYQQHFLSFTEHSMATLSRLLYASTALLSILSPPAVALPAPQAVTPSQYLIGVGIGDVTGPVVETNMFGYAYLSQTDVGVHMRQRSRAYIVAQSDDPSQRILYVNADLWSGDTAIRRGILQKLEAKYPGVYTEANFALVGTHTHAGVGGYANNLLPQITSLGFVKQTYDAIIAGTVNAIEQAHESLSLGTLSVGNTTLADGGINRSAYAYLANPEQERARYNADHETDFSLLRFTDASGKDKGFISFFAVHGTSLYENNTLISGDNKGLAAYFYESLVEPDAMPGQTSFVAGFSPSTSGDVTPNTLGAYCESPGQPWDGQPCDFQTSTCGGTAQDCRGRGPGYLESDFRSNEIIAQRQFNAAKSVMSSSNLQSISGPVKSLHSYEDMSKYSFTLANGTQVTTCSPALGYSFAGGTSDGPGAFDFVQGTNSTEETNPFWELVKGAITPAPSAAQIACHYPKQILLNVGSATFPYQWSPTIVDIQILRVGQFVMLILPSEFTTMSGRRIREAVRAQLIANGIVGDDAYVVATGPANVYAHYTTTREEYSVQRYEGGSTLYGPFQLEAYIDLYTKYLTYISGSSTGVPPIGPIPEDLTNKAISLQTGVVMDNTPIGKSFGSVVTDVSASYSAGQTVTVVFQGANPRNNLRLEGSFITVERQDGSQWTVVRTDSHPSTTYVWTRTNFVLGYSTVQIKWVIESGTQAGKYRIRYYGDSKALIGGAITAFTGTSSVFTVA